MDIVITGKIGAAGTAELAAKYSRELAACYPARFLAGCKLLRPDDDRDEIIQDLAHKAGAEEIMPCSGQGLLTDLWHLAEARCTGIMVELNRIPIAQETVEICEFFDYNPYRMNASGSSLIVTESGSRLAEACQEAGITAAVIGRETADNDRIIQMPDGRKQFLTPE